MIGETSSIPRPNLLPPKQQTIAPLQHAAPAARRLMPPKAGGIHFRRPHLKSLGSPHDGYHRVGRGATWIGETSSIPRPSILPRDSDGRPLWAARFIAAKRGKGLTFPPFRDNIVRAETAMTEQVPLTPPHQRRVPWLEGPAAGGRETAPPAGPETGAVPFPQQKARGRF